MRKLQGYTCLALSVLKARACSSACGNLTSLGASSLGADTWMDMRGGGAGLSPLSPESPGAPGGAPGGPKPEGAAPSNPAP